MTQAPPSQEVVGLPQAPVGPARTGLTRIPAFAVLSERSFQSLWLSNTVSVAANELRLMAQAWLILSIGASQVWVGVANGLTAIPAIPLILYFGVLSDTKGGRWVLLVDRAALVIVTGIMAGVIIGGELHLWHIVLLSAVVGAVFAGSMAPTQMLVPSFVKRETLQVANSLNSLSFSVARALGPLTGGFLIAAFGIRSPFVAVCGMAIICLSLTLRIMSVPGAGATGVSPAKRIWEGFVYAQQNRAVGWLLVLAASLLFASGWMVAVPVYAKTVLDVGEKGYGGLLAAFAVGHGASAAYIALSGGMKRKGVGIVVAALVWAAGTVVFAYSRNFGLSLAVMVVLGAMPPLWLSGIVTLPQLSTEKDRLGRVMAIFAVSTQLAALGWLVGGSLGAAIGNEYMIIVTSGTFAVLHIAAIVLLPEMRAKR